MADKKPERKQECVQVVVRCRPFSTKETRENRGNIIAMETALFQARMAYSCGVYILYPYHDHSTSAG